MNNREVVKFSIRTKLFVFVLVAFAVLILTTVWQIGRQAQAVSNQAINRSLAQSSVVLETKIESRFNSILEVATGIARDGRILPLVYEGASETLQDQSLEFQKVLDFDILFFTNAEGLVLARSDRPDAIGQNMAGKAPFFDQALNGGPSRGYFQSQGRLFQIVVVPVFDNVASDLVRGTVALAYEFSGDMAEEINSLTASDIGFFIFQRERSGAVTGAISTYNTDEALGSRLDGYFRQQPEKWQRITEDSVAADEMEIALEGEDYFSVVHRLSNAGGPPLGFVMAMRSRAELLKPYIDLQRMVVLVGSLCLFVASVFAWIFSRRISRPIIELVSMTQEIQEGQYPERDGGLRSSDEIGLLYRAVLKMGTTLREKAELENYLAQISNELNLSGRESLMLEADELLGTQSLISQSHIKAPGAQETALTVDVTQVIDTSEISARIGGGTGLLTSGVIVDDRYELLQAIGNGAMGIVFLALDKGLNEKVAIKIIAKELFSRHETINFKEEIRLARRITHRNILRTFDFGEWLDFYYITMEYVSGYDLDQMIKRKGCLDEHIGILMARQICSAIGAAHAQGIIHLDLKPANMMINRQGILKIMDFGLARKLASDVEGAAQIAEQHTDNREKTIVGTPKYMAPEQFLNESLDERTDLYAIGIILFTLFAGHPPYEGENFMAIAEQHLHGELPEIIGKSGPISPNLTAIIVKAVEKNPADRFQSAAELLDAINHL